MTSFEFLLNTSRIQGCELMYSSGYNVWEQPTAYSYRIMQKTCSAKTFIPGIDIDFCRPQSFRHSSGTTQPHSTWTGGDCLHGEQRGRNVKLTTHF